MKISTKLCLFPLFGGLALVVQGMAIVDYGSVACGVIWVLGAYAGKGLGD